MDNIRDYNKTVFESIKHIDDMGNEYWFARELMSVLEYKEWRKFKNVINKSKVACNNSETNYFYYFVQVDKIVKTGVATKKIIDYKLSRYACYLIVQNSDSSKKVVALGQTYFAIQTRKQEINEKEFEMLSEDEKRFYERRQTKDKNLILYNTAKKAGVKNFDIFI